jgi:hypothetical protein
MAIRDDVYFAAYEMGDPTYLEALIDKINVYRNYCESSGKLSKWQRAMQNYFGVSSDGTKASNLVTRGGDEGQLTMAKVNDYRNLVQHELILITSQRPAGEGKAINSDPDALKNARIASMMTEYYLDQVGWEQRFVRCAELALVVEEGFVTLDWDATAGDAIRPMADADGNVDPNGKMMMTGDPVQRVVAPWNMARDPYLQSADDMKWGIYGYRVNKFDLAAKFPFAKDEILDCKAQSKLKELIFENVENKATDQTHVFVMAHAPTDACPKGRWTLFIPEKVLLDSLELPYDEFNIYRMSQNDMVDSPFGYSNNNDLLALEEVTDALHSIIISNQTAFGGQCIIGPKGVGLDHTQLAKGFAYFEIDPAHIDKVKPLQLTKTAPEIFEYLETLSRKKETISGINSVVRGDPEGALRSNSGSALALVQAQSIQFNSGGQRSYYQILSKVNTGNIRLLQRYANSERVVRICGKVQGQYLQELKVSKESLRGVSSVVFEMVNPIEKTIGGKEALAKDLLDKGMITNPRTYLTLARTGNFDVVTEDDEAIEIGIRAENQWLRDGKPITAIWTENHEEHIQAHRALISSPEAKQNMQLVKAVQDHIQQHIDLWDQYSMGNPAYLIATKQKVLPPPPPPPGAMPPPGPGGPGGPPPPPGGPAGPGPKGPPGPPPPPPGGPQQNPVKMMGPQSPAEVKAASVKQPSMPTNPMNGQKVPMPGQMGP